MDFKIKSYEEWFACQDLAELREARKLETLYKSPTDGLPLLGSVPFAFEMGYGLCGVLDDDSAARLAELLLASVGKYDALFLDVGDGVSLRAVVVDEAADFAGYLRVRYARYVDCEIDGFRRALV